MEPLVCELDISTRLIVNGLIAVFAIASLYILGLVGIERPGTAGWESLFFPAFTVVAGYEFLCRMAIRIEVDRDGYATFRSERGVIDRSHLSVITVREPGFPAWARNAEVFFTPERKILMFRPVSNLPALRQRVAQAHDRAVPYPASQQR